jgi:hypothetical protein
LPAAISSEERVARLVAAHVTGGGRVDDPALTATVMGELGVSDRQARRRLEPFRKGQL